MRLFLKIILAFFVVGSVACAPMERKPTIVKLPKTPEMEAAFHNAEQAFLAQRYERSIELYTAYINNFSYNHFTPKANYRIGEVYYTEEEWKKAIPYYQESLRKGIFPDWGEKAAYELAASYYNIDDFPNTFRSLEQLPDQLEASLRVKAGSLRVTAARKSENKIEEIQGLLNLVDAYSTLPHSEWRIGDLTWVVDNKETHDGVREWANAPGTMDDIKWFKDLFKEHKGDPASAFILWKIVRTVHEAGDYERAARLAERYLRQNPKHEYVPSARMLLAEMGKRESGIRPRVGVILPLSGRLAIYGNSVLHGLECASGIFEPCRGDLGVSLEVRDSRGEPKTAKRLVRELAGMPDVVAIIGPLSQDEADEVAPLAEHLEVPIIALSQKPKLPLYGRYVFRNFLTIADQVATVVHHACRKKGFREFAILYPEGEGGEEYLKRYEKQVGDCGGKVVARSLYELDSPSFLGPLRNLKHSRETYAVGKKAPFEVLFFPGVYRHVPDIITNLEFLKMDNIQLMGGAGWDHPELIEKKLEGLEGSIFVNGFYSKSGEFKTKDFVGSFRSAYDVEPTLLEAYAYDTLKLIGGILHGRPGITRPDLQRELSRVKNFKGVTGNISFDEQGDARRRLFLLTVKNGEIREVR